MAFKHHLPPARRHKHRMSKDPTGVGHNTCCHKCRAGIRDKVQELSEESFSVSRILAVRCHRVRRVFSWRKRPFSSRMAVSSRTLATTPAKNAAGRDITSVMGTKASATQPRTFLTARGIRLAEQHQRKGRDHQNHQSKTPHKISELMNARRCGYRLFHVRTDPVIPSRTKITQCNTIPRSNAEKRFNTWMSGHSAAFFNSSKARPVPRATQDRGSSAMDTGNPVERAQHAVDVFEVCPATG